MSVSLAEVGWIAGLVEGEGCIIVRPQSNTLRLSIEMTDLDVLQKAARLFGPTARLSQRTIKLPNPKHKPRYILHLTGSPMMQWLMTIYSFMGVRRKQKIEDAIRMFKARRNRPSHGAPGRHRATQYIEHEGVK